MDVIDASFLLMTGTPPIWDDAWAGEQCRPAIPDHGEHQTVAEMVHQRISDYEQFRATWRAVFGRPRSGRTSWFRLGSTRVVVGRRFRPQVATTYSARVAGPAG